MSIEVKRGQGRVFDTMEEKLRDLTTRLTNAKKVHQITHKGKGFQVLVR